MHVLSHCTAISHAKCKFYGRVKMAMMRGTKIVEPAQLRLIGSISIGEREAAVFRCTFFTDRRSPWKYATPRPMFPVIGILSMRVRFVPPSQPHFTREHSAVFEEERVANLENFSHGGLIRLLVVFWGACILTSLYTGIKSICRIHVHIHKVHDAILYVSCI